MPYSENIKYKKRGEIMKKYICILIALMCSVLCAAPVAAAVYEPLWKGEVLTVDYETATITVEVSETYACTYAEGKSTPCGFEPAEHQIISAIVTDPTVYDIIEAGTPVIGKSYGGFESADWSALAKISQGDEMYIEALFGDISLLDIAPLAAGYSVTFGDMQALCDACTGTRCPATSVDLTISCEGAEDLLETLSPGQGVSYSGREDGTRISITFVTGEVSSLICNPENMMPGPQARQDFTIIVTVQDDA